MLITDGQIVAWSWRNVAVRSRQTWNRGRWRRCRRRQGLRTSRRATFWATKDGDIDEDDRLAGRGGAGEPARPSRLLAIVFAVVDAHGGSGGRRLGGRAGRPDGVEAPTPSSIARPLPVNGIRSANPGPPIRPRPDRLSRRSGPRSLPGGSRRSARRSRARSGGGVPWPGPRRPPGPSSRPWPAPSSSSGAGPRGRPSRRVDLGQVENDHRLDIPANPVEDQVGGLLLEADRRSTRTRGSPRPPSTRPDARS